MALECAHERPTFAFRTKGRIHFEETPGADFDEFAGYTGCFRIGGLANEDDVDVGDVVQFTRAAFTHRDDRQSGIDGGGGGVHRGDGDRECSGERCVGKIG